MITICDTGPLVAFLDRHDDHHGWATELLDRTPEDLLTCEAVLTETAYFLRARRLDLAPLFELLEGREVRVAFDVRPHWPRLRVLMARYPRMDFADACIVAMTERYRRCRVLTVDRHDFSTYRRNDRQVIDFVAPEA